MRQEKTSTPNILAAMAIGAGCMYLLDPVNGRRRRILIRDKFVRLSHAVEEGTGTAARDFTNRTWGIASSVARVFQKPTGDDQVLQPRVRSEMGRWVSHPHAIHVDAREGRIVLSGDILASEQDNLLKHIERMPGVKKVENRLRAHETGENLPSLQGGSRRESRFEYLQTNWAPGPRLLAAVAGAAMVGSGIRSRGLIGWETAVSGAILFARAVSNVELSRLFGSAWFSNRPQEQTPQEKEGVSIPINRKEPGEYRIH